MEQMTISLERLSYLSSCNGTIAGCQKWINDHYDKMLLLVKKLQDGETLTSDEEREMTICREGIARNRDNLVSAISRSNYALLGYPLDKIQFH